MAITVLFSYLPKRFKYLRKRAKYLCTPIKASRKTGSLCSHLSELNFHSSSLGIHLKLSLGLAFITATTSTTLLAASLPSDRADVMYHSYDDGDVALSGPSLLIRKTLQDRVSLYGHYALTDITDNATDTQTPDGNEYRDQRTTYRLGADYLFGKTGMHASVTQATEDDYEAQSFNVDISQEFFGDMTTLTMGYSRDSDLLGRLDEDKNDWTAITRNKFRLGINQILLPTWQLGISAEKNSVQGERLFNPYLNIHIVQDNGDLTTSNQRHPTARDSDSVTLSTRYYLPYRASLKGELRYYADSWGITAQTADLRYLQPYDSQWLFQIGLRTYSQSQADFYNDLLSPETSNQTLASRDKTLSEFQSYSVSLGITYEWDYTWSKRIDRTTFNLELDYVQYDYQNFRDSTERFTATPSVQAGEEPLYALNGTALRFFVSVYY